jgi:ligand-binding sensor domain-containing protein/signal transduction histidine kinase/DNA-binding response OmpR family regulator
LALSNLALFSQGKKPIFQSLQQGLSNQIIQCIIKDSKGFLWFGTSDGLNKFDGANIFIYENNSDDSTSISHSTINALIEDKHYNLWIGTADGLNLYNRAKDNFVNIKIPGIDRLYVSALCSDTNGNVWIGAVGIGVILFDYKNSKFTFYPHNDTDTTSISSNYITSIVIDKQQNVWIGTNAGINLFNREQKNFSHFNNPAGLSTDFVSTLYMDRKGDLWVGTMVDGLYRLIIKDKKFTFTHYRHLQNANSISNNNILSLCEDHKGNLWIGTDNGGLNCLNFSSEVFTAYHPEDGNPKSLNSNSIHSLYCDNNNIIWIGTHNHGINFVDEKFEKFELFQKNSFSKNSIQNNDVTGFAEDSYGNIWIATDGGGICKFDINTRNFTNFLKEAELTNNYVQTIICDKNDNIWIGTWNGGIDRINKSGVRIKNYKVEGFQKKGDNKIRFLYEDRLKNIWAGTSGSGLFLYKPDVDKFIQITDNLGVSGKSTVSYVTSILEDHQNNIWVGTMDGLICMKRVKNEFSFSVFYTNRNNPNSISSNRITVIFEDSKKNLWFGTHEKGINLFDRKSNSFIKFQKKDGLPSNSIKGILEDKKGNLWVSTNKGISEFNPALRTYKNYTKEDGLNSDEFHINSCIKVRSGEFFFGGINGFNTFFPDSIKTNTSVPPIYLTDFKIFNKSVPVGLKNSPLQKHISETKKIVLSHKQNSFTIEFIALNYTRSSQNQYAYILEGLEKDWNYVKHKRSASYTYIHPGNYVFKVIGSNNDGIWNETPIELKITILPPFWKTIWAFILYFLIIFGLLFAYVRLSVIRAQQAQLLELDKMKLDFFANISHELRTPLTLIISPLEGLLSSPKIENSLKSKLSIVYRNAGRLFRLVNELMDFVKAEDSKLTIRVQPGDLVEFTKEVFNFYSNEAIQKNIDYKFVNKEASIEVWFDRDKLEKIIMNLLSNAFKFTSPNGKITVIIEKARINDTLNSEYAKISVIDDGIGISQKYLNKIFDRFFQSPEEKNITHTGTGIGLALCKSLVNLHHGKIEVTSEKNKETCFSVYLQFGNSHFDKDEIIEDISEIQPTNTSAIDQDEINQVLPKNAHLILIVEDNYDMRKYIVSQLSGKYRFVEAENGMEGYNIAVKEIPDLIISDILMPKLSGLEFCKKIKETLTTSHIPVILLTAKATTEEKIEGIQTGADVYITKPFDIRFLHVTIKNLIETRLKLYQRFSQEVFIMPREFSNNSLDQNFLERVIDFIEKNISNEELIIKDLASHLLLSHSQTYRKIKALTGQSVTELIRTIRLKMAIKLMETGKYNVSEIAFEVGFTSPAYFTKCFREQFGKPPSEYLSELKNRKA